MAVVDVSTVPANVTLANVGSHDEAIKIARYSQSFVLTAGNSVVLRADTSSEVLGYLGQQSKTLTVTFAAVPASKPVV